MFLSLYTWYEKEFLYKSILKDSNMIYLGENDDTRYQEVYDSLKNGSTGQVEKLYALIESKQYDLAQALNNQLSENEIWISNIKAATQIYLNTWAKGIQVLSGEDSTILWPIALMTPYEGGNGVYTARFMLGIDPENFNVPYHSVIKSKSELQEFSLYPNPASGSVVIHFDKLVSSEGKLELYGLTGKLEISIPITLSGNETSVSIREIKSGIYFCRFSSPLFLSKTQKLVIIK